MPVLESDTLTDPTWTATNSPYRLTRNVVVPFGGSLSIEPGVDVLFDADVEFVIHGALRTVGTLTDSIRFMRGSATTWGGIRISGGDSSTLAYVRIADGYAYEGGGLSVAGATTRVTVSHSVISGNSSGVSKGGGIFNGSGALVMENSSICSNMSNVQGGGVFNDSGTLTLVDCAIKGNGAGDYGGGMFNQGTAFLTDCRISGNSTYAEERGDGGGIYNIGLLTLARCVVDGNTAAMGKGGGIANTGGGYLTGTRCTISGNLALVRDNMYNAVGGIYSVGVAELNSSIIWGNRDVDIFTANSFSISYSSLLGYYPGTGNVLADPLFADPSSGDYRLLPGSPCVDAGDPNSPLDADGTRADIGALGLAVPAKPEPFVRLTHVESLPGRAIDLPIIASVNDARSMEMAFLADMTAVEGVEVLSHAFAADPNSIVVANISGDTVFVVLSGTENVTLSDGVAAMLSLTVRMDADTGTTPLSWVPYPVTNVDEEAVGLADGKLSVSPALYGDVTSDSLITAQDATWILQHSVRLRPVINIMAADVSKNGRASAYDAALVLHKVVHPEYAFPVLDGPLIKQALAPPRSLAFVPAEGGWNLVVSQPDGIIGCDLELLLPDGGSATFSGDGAIEHAMDGQTALVGIARAEFTNPVLLHVAGAAGLPQIVSASLNEGAIPTLLPEPVAFTLSQNMPNPFNPSTTLRFGLPEAGHVTLAVYDVNGRLVRNLAAGRFEAGRHEVVWDGKDDNGREVASGVYLARLTAPQGVVTRKMMLLR